MQPREGALDDPAARAKPGAVGAAAAGEDWLDAPRPQLPAVLVMVIAAVGDQRLGALAGRPRLPRTGPMPSMSGSSWVTSLRLPPVSEIASGIPPESVSRWCLEPVRARSTGEGPVKAPLKSTDVAAIDHRGGPVDQPGRVEPPQQLAVQRREHPSGLPLLQPAMRGRR